VSTAIPMGVAGSEGGTEAALRPPPLSAAAESLTLHAERTDFASFASCERGDRYNPRPAAQGGGARSIL
jgi:hypothetical protein